MLQDCSETLKNHPRANPDAQKLPQELPKSSPREPQEPPRDLQEHPRSSQEGPKSFQDGAQERKIDDDLDVGSQLGAQEAPGSIFGRFWDDFWTVFGLIFDDFGVHFFVIF